MRGKPFVSYQFDTRQLPCLKLVLELFYDCSSGRSVRRISPTLLCYFDDLALAHWIMGDGSKRNQGITLCTDGFTIQEVVLLINILILKYDISPTHHKEKNCEANFACLLAKNNFRIYIGKNDWIKFRLP